jgi:tRNA U34 5-methylaminomethyl-2-thiouridine-forming methyltransferase MnmC
MQARERYVAPCRLGERAAEAGRTVLRLLDIGTGLGLNLAAALEALAGTRVRLEVLGLERDPSIFAAARALLAELPAASGLARLHSEVVERLLAATVAPGRSVELPGGGRLELWLGDARDELRRAPLVPPFDAVFLDPFSPAREPELWEEPFLFEIARRMAPHAILSTYSSAFRVRSALARAGLRVGLGPRVGAKAEGTLASPSTDLPAFPERIRCRLERARGSGEAPPAAGASSGETLVGDRGSGLD